MIMKEVISLNENDDLQEKYTLPRSRFFNIEPEGMGTFMVESLLSYLLRLSEKHQVPVWILLDKEVSNHFSKDFLKDYVKKRQSNHIHYINGCCEITEDYLNALEFLTARDDLINLTLLNSRGLLNTKRNILKKQRTWCSMCFENWRTNNVEIYEPLIWNIKYITCCPVHQIKLEEKCPSCGLNNGLISFNQQVGYCGKCGEWLGRELGDNKISMELSDWDKWSIPNIKNLLEFFQRSSFVPLGKYSSIIIRFLINQYADGNISEFQRLFKIEHDNVSGRHCISFEKLLNLSFTFKTSIVDLINFNTKNNKNINYLAKGNYQEKQQTKNEVDVKELRKELLQILECDLKPPLSMAQVIKISKYSSYALYKHAKDLCEEITLKRRLYTLEQKNEKRKRIKVEVTKVIEELLNEGIYPTEHLVNSKLQTKVFNKDLKPIIEEIVMEFRIK